jgi:3-oxoadipate enol-lactonase
MPRIDVGGAKLYYEEHGQGRETVVFAHGLLWSGRMFAEQVQTLREKYRCITFDFRGHGRSQVTANGYEIDQLTTDVGSLIETLACGACHFVGLSMGGYVGLRLAIRQPHLLRSLSLLNSSSDSEPLENVGRYRKLAAISRWLGLRIVIGRVMPMMFGPKFLNDPRRAELRKKCLVELLANNRVGVSRAVQGVVSRDSVFDQLAHITIPTMVVVGEHDLATPPEVGLRVHTGIANSRLIRLADSGHTSTIEEPEAVTSALIEFLDQVTRNLH